MEVMVSFIEIVDGVEIFIMTMGIEVYPTYKTGDTVFLQSTNHEDHKKSMKLTKFKVDGVTHSVREDVSRNHRNIENNHLVAFGCKYFLGIEVYVSRVD